MLFSYQITDSKGKISGGEIEASSLVEAKNILASKEGTVIYLSELSKSKIKKKGGAKSITFGKIKMLEKVMFAKHLSVMIKSGMSIDGALEVLAEGASPLMAKRLEEILVDVRKGNSLSSALKKYPRDFDLLFVNMVAVGEKGGTLSKNLNLLSVQQQKSYELKNKIKSAAMYPTIILLAIFGLIAVISVFVLPKITGFFTTLKVELPLTTRILIATSNFFSDYWWLVLIFVVAILAALKIMSRIPGTRFILHNITLHLPVVGKISKNMNLALYCRTLSSLLDSGIPIDNALQIVSQTLTNDVYKREVTKIYHSILKGTSLADSIKNKDLFPSIVSRMSKVGERSGNLSEVLDYLADFYELEVDTTTKNLSTMLEPILLAFIGLVVAFVAMSIINPIYDLTSKVGR
jgi:type IV pilus assembly protein PilC